jgi:hypothetical protein
MRCCLPTGTRILFEKLIAAQLVKKSAHRGSWRIVIGKGPARHKKFEVFTMKKYTKCFSGESCVVVELNPRLRRLSFKFLWVGWDWVHFVLRLLTNWPIVPAPDGRWWMWSSRWNYNWQGKPQYSEKTCPSATLSTTNPIWPDLGWNLDCRGGKPATNRLSYGTASRRLVLTPSSGLMWGW